MNAQFDAYFLVSYLANILLDSLLLRPAR